MLSEEIILNNFTKDEIDQMLKILPKDEQIVMRMYFGITCDKLTLEEISNMIKIPVWRLEQAKLNSLIVLDETYDIANRIA